MKKYTGLEIAIIGMSGKFPGADNVGEFWDNIKNGVESVEFFTEEELIEGGEDPELIKNPAYVPANSYLKNKEYFDSDFFGFRPDEAKLMDPQMRMYHECVWEALEDAGCSIEGQKNKIGMFAGAGNNTNWVVYSELLNQQGLVDRFTASNLNDSRFIPTKMSYYLNLRGPSVFLDTACSTSLVAIQQASKSLILGDCKIAIAGGISLTNKAKSGYMYHEGMILSKDGHCRTFDENASGTVGGEGAAVVVLKTMKNAIEDGDHIYAIVKGGGVNNDGNSKVGYTAPSVDGQTEAIMMAHKWSKIEPESVSYIEAHGTATKMGDPIEVEGLKRVFGKSTEKYCGLGALKTNIGHLDAAAGAASVIKTAMALKNRLMPPTINFSSANPDINFLNTPFYVNTELKKWENGEHPLRAGVSAFGIGGTNAHIVMEEAPDQEPSSESRAYQMLPFSAKTPKALNRIINKYISYFENNSNEKLSDIAYTLQVGRSTFAYRKTITANNTSEAIDQLKAELDAKEFYFDKQNTPRKVFLFSGQGAQYVNMGKELYDQEKTFQVAMDECFSIIKATTGRDLKAIVFSDQKDKINLTRNTQPLLFAIGYSLVQLLKEWGIAPDMMIGHSVGEYAVACVSGVFSLKDALTLIVKRGELMQGVESGDMLSVSATEKRLNQYLNGREDISIAAINSTELCVVAGTKTAIENFKSQLDKLNVGNSILRTSHAFHSYMMDDILKTFEIEVRKVNLNKTTIPFISNLTGKPITDEEATNPMYWVKHLRNTVKFEVGVNLLLQQKNTVFIEIGPGKVLSSLVKSNSNKLKSHVVINTMRSPKDQVNDIEHLMNGVSKLWKSGIQIDWVNFYKNEKRRKVSLPTYSFERIKYPVNVDAFKIISKMMAGQHQTDLNTLLTDDFSENSSADETNEKSSTSDLISDDSVHASLLNIWENFFGKNNLEDDDDFFEIGGDSLKAITIINRINKNFRVDINLTEFSSNSTIKGLASLIKGKVSVGDSGINEWSIPKAPSAEYYPLSSAQKRLYFLSEFDKKSTAYNLPHFIKLSGELEKTKLANAFNKLIQHHDLLGAQFQEENMVPVQKIRANVDFELDEYNSSPNELDELLNAFIRPFDLKNDLLIRAGIIRLDEGEHILMFDVHHIVSDGVSQSIIMHDLLNFYNGGEALENEIKYTDYSTWQQGSAQQNAISKQKEFWMEMFDKEREELELPTDFSRPAVKSYEGNSLSFDLSSEESNGLKTLAQANGVTTFTIVLAIYNIFLSKIGNTNDVVIGTPSAGRLQSDLERTVGMFVNTVSIFNSVDSNLKFSTFLERVNTTSMACFDNQQYPYEELIDALKIERRTDRNPLFEVFFSFQNIENVSIEIPKLKLVPFEKELNMSQFDLQLSSEEEDGQLKMRFDYCKALFKEETINSFESYFRQIIQSVISQNDPLLSEIQIHSEKQRENIIQTFSNKEAFLESPISIVSAFEKVVSDNSNSSALTFDRKTISYSELNEKANQLARSVLNSGTKKGGVVGIMMNRSSEMVVSMIAILKAGCTYLPIDPDYPLDRIHHVVENSELKLILSDTVSKELIDQLTIEIDVINLDTAEINTEEWSNLNLDISPDDLAYMIYTSGSTGKPKGVMITHENVINFNNGVSQRIGLTSDQTVLSLTTMSFDIFVLESLVPLMNGCEVVIGSSDDQKDTIALAQLFTDATVDTVQMTPSHVKLLLSSEKSAEMLQNVQTLLVGGEAFPLTTLQDLQKVYNGKIFNMYGPTETTVWSTIKELTNEESITIGTPISNTSIYIVDQDMNLQPYGISGELCIGGLGVAKGYWTNKELTDDKFVANPFEVGTLMYRTGDSATYLRNGEVAFKGRIDNQVKLRGFRIEPGDIESNLNQLDAIKESTVLVKKRGGDAYLVGYYVSDEAIENQVIKEHLRQQLPHYMIPDFLVHLKEYPLTPNGKLNKKALPDPLVTNEQIYVAPSNDTEKILVDIWSEILNLPSESISMKSNFFELGGQSLKATFMVNKLNNHFETEIALTEIFSKQTIESLADYIITIRPENGTQDQNEDLIEISI